MEISKIITKFSLEVQQFRFTSWISRIIQIFGIHAKTTLIISEIQIHRLNEQYNEDFENNGKISLFLCEIWIHKLHGVNLWRYRNLLQEYRWYSVNLYSQLKQGGYLQNFQKFVKAVILRISWIIEDFEIHEKTCRLYSANNYSNPK